MIAKLILRNFKSVGEQVYEFAQFDLLVGCNNSGKSTLLQALAVWQFCVDEFHRCRMPNAALSCSVSPNNLQGRMSAMLNWHSQDKSA